MNEKMLWTLNPVFTDSYSWAPYFIKNDIDYYDDLANKYNLLYECAKKAGADEESLDSIIKYSKNILMSIENYYEGKISNTHKVIKELVNEIISEPLAVSVVNKSKAFPGMGIEIQFYRARKSEEVTSYKSKDMLHIPFKNRGKTGNYRFSIPGIPSLYIGNSTYACWLELGCPPDYKFNVSPVQLDGTQKILNLAVMTRDQSGLDDGNVEYIHCWLKLLMLMMATSYVTEEENRVFKSEYIVSQSIMLACKELGLDGVAYYSKRVKDEIFGFCAVNLALFTKYEKGKDYSNICEHIKIDNSFNYSVYKQLGFRDRTDNYNNYRLENTRIINNMGSYRRQFKYTSTEFSNFDQFLFRTWEEKDKISFGNALL